MATENENQNNVPLTTEMAAASSEKVVTITCGICEATISDDDSKLICTNKQCAIVTCNICISTMIKVMFGQPALNYPLTCGACSCAFDTTDIDRILVKQEHYEQFMTCVFSLFWQKDCLQDNEKLAQCMYSINYSFSYIK